MSQNQGWGPYGDPGRGAGWGPPPPPQPGVIPLRPLGIGDLLGGAMSAIGRYKSAVFGIPLVVFGVYSVVVGVAVLLAVSGVADAVPDFVDAVDDPSRTEPPPWEVFQPFVVAFVSVIAVLTVGYVIAVATVQAAMLAVLQSAVVGRPATFGSVWREALPRVPALIGTTLLSGLIAMIPTVLAVVAFSVVVIGTSVAAVSGDGDDGAAAGVILVVGLLGALVTAVPAIWLYVKFILAPAAVVFEKQGPIAALRRSSRLVRGRWWPVFGITILVALIAGVIAGVVQQVLVMVGMVPLMTAASDLGPDPQVSDVVSVVSVYVVIVLVAQLVGYLIQTTFPPLVNGLLYVDQRIRNENLAPALAESAAAHRTPGTPGTPGF
ncbi:hypothetical protein ABZO31_07140 [Streptomyces sp. HUAS MG47]|uniref:DUF7847 domain-containing protein n=1 Tax=Streptomyces solicamelliae TaxID=3231716 RepID=UPI003878367B